MCKFKALGWSDPIHPSSNSLGQSDAALAVLESARQRFPADFDIAWALATMYRDQGALERALEVSENLLQSHPEQLDVVSLHESLVNVDQGDDR